MLFSFFFPWRGILTLERFDFCEDQLNHSLGIWNSTTATIITRSEVNSAHHIGFEQKSLPCSCVEVGGKCPEVLHRAHLACTRTGREEASAPLYGRSESSCTHLASMPGGFSKESSSTRQNAVLETTNVLNRNYRKST